MKQLLFLLSLFLAVGAGVSVYNDREAKLDASHVVLRFERVASWSCALCSVDIFVNDVKVGSVGNGSTKKFRFKPRADGNNAIFAKLVWTIGPNSDSNAVNFNAKEGSVVYARYEVNPWVMKLTADTKLEAVVEKEGPKQIAGQARSTAVAAAPISANVSSKGQVPWDAIGAVAGVLSLIAAIIALYK